MLIDEIAELKNKQKSFSEMIQLKEMEKNISEENIK